jgi:hypothetical protein
MATNNSNNKPTLQKYRDAFIAYVEGPECKAQIPVSIKQSTDSEFLIFIISNMRPFRNDINLCYSRLLSLIQNSGITVPPIGDAQKAKICRFLECFIEIADS